MRKDSNLELQIRPELSAGGRRPRPSACANPAARRCPAAWPSNCAAKRPRCLRSPPLAGQARGELGSRPNLKRDPRWPGSEKRSIARSRKPKIRWTSFTICCGPGRRQRRSERRTRLRRLGDRPPAPGRRPASLLAGAIKGADQRISIRPIRSLRRTNRKKAVKW